MAFTFKALKGEYTRLLGSMRIIREKEAAATASRLEKNRIRYQAIEQAIGVPWRFIAALHYRESGGDFRGVLHNGERIIGSSRKTKLVPAGHGPFKTWEEAAIDALKLKGFDEIRDWSLERMCFCAESYNGWGYRNKGVPSSYLWAGSTNYKAGKFIADHVWSATAIDKQLGCMVVLSKLAEFEARDTAASPPPPDIEPIPVRPSPKRLGAILFALWSALFKRS